MAAHPKRTKKVATLQQPMRIYQKGDRVQVVRSVYANINVGDVGIVDCHFHNGYGVEFNKHWPDIVSHQKIEQKPRIHWFAMDEVTAA